MNMEKKKDFLVNSAYYLLILVLAYLGLHYLLPMMMPFVVGFLLAYLVVKLSGRLRLPNRWFRLLLAIAIYAIAGTLLGLIAARLISAASDFLGWLPRLYSLKLEPAASAFYEWLSQTLEGLDPRVAQVLTEASKSLGGAFRQILASISGLLVSLVSGAATGVPSVVLSTLAMIFSTVFCVMDYDRIREFASGLLSPRCKEWGRSIREYLTGTLFVVLRAYLLIMLLTFGELSVLFLLFGIENAIVKAAAIAVMDILPLLGTGAVMIPWAIVSFIGGYTGLGIELLIIYGIVTVVRNYVEPRIVGTQLGLHPVVTLVSMFVGLRLIGFWGLFGFPVAISYFWKRYKEKCQASPQGCPQ